MAYTVPHAIGVGELVSIATMNNEWGGNVAFLANPPACRVYHSVAQPETDNTQLILAFDSERFDTDTMHSTVTNNSRITIKTAGLYMVGAHLEFAAGTLDKASVALRLNGGTFFAVQETVNTAAAYGQALTVVGLWKFAVADYVEVRMFQDNAANTARNVNSSINYSAEFWAVWTGLG